MLAGVNKPAFDRPCALTVEQLSQAVVPPLRCHQCCDWKTLTSPALEPHTMYAD